MEYQSLSLTPIEIISPEEMRENCYEWHMELEDGRPEGLQEFLYEQAEGFTDEMEADCSDYRDAVREECRTLEANYSKTVEYNLAMPRYIKESLEKWYDANSEYLVKRCEWFDLDECLVGLTLEAIHSMEKEDMVIESM